MVIESGGLQFYGLQRANVPEEGYILGKAFFKIQQAGAPVGDRRHGMGNNSPLHPKGWVERQVGEEDRTWLNAAVTVRGCFRRRNAAVDKGSNRSPAGVRL